MESPTGSPPEFAEMCTCTVLVEYSHVCTYPLDSFRRIVVVGGLQVTVHKSPSSAAQRSSPARLSPSMYPDCIRKPPGDQNRQIYGAMTWWRAGVDPPE
jgi:hypothetical protein